MADRHRRFDEMRAPILLASGRYFDLLDPASGPIEIGDIAAALSRLCRFNGHCGGFYSVAQHSVLVSFEADPEDAREALLHDAAEAFVGDVVAPLKALLGDYRQIEDSIAEAIAHRFGLVWPWPASVKRADLVLLATERDHLMPETATRWPVLDGISPQPIGIRPLLPRHAQIEFLMRAGTLQIDGAAAALEAA